MNQLSTLRRARALLAVLIFTAFSLISFAQAPIGYRVVRQDNGRVAGDLYEGGEGYFILERLTGLNLPSVAEVTVQTVTEAESIFLAGTPAIPGEDFIPATTQVEFAAGQATARVYVSIINDTAVEELVEFFKIRHPRAPDNPELVDEFAGIMGNEFNPLPARPLCLGGLPVTRLSRLLPLANGKIMAMIPPLTAGGITDLLRFSADGEVDATFAVTSLGGAGIEMQEVAGGKLLILDSPGESSYRLRRFNADGTIDQTFATYSLSGFVPRLIPAPDGKVFVTEPRTVTRLNAFGAVDATFTRPSLSDNVTSGVVAPDGSLYITGQFETVNAVARPYIAHLSATGLLDDAFAPTGRAFPISFWNGAPHIAQDGILYRLTAAGARDPNFAPIPLPNNDRALHIDAQGRFYRLRYAQGWVVERFSPQGAADPTYFPGSIQTRFDSPVAWLAQGSAFMLGQISEINSVPMRCGADPSAYSAGLARIELDAPLGAILIEPGYTRFVEGSADPAALRIIRTGPNTLPSDLIRYRLRNGTAIAGRDFQADATGQFTFAAGAARHSIPIQIFDDTEIEQDVVFYIDFLRPDDSVLATSELSIVSNDAGIKILRKIAGDEWEILPLVGDIEWADLRSTADFQTWDHTIVPANQPLRLHFSQPHRFFICTPWQTGN